MGTKILILVRHGQYHRAEGTKLERLTTLGRKQAKLVGRRLRENKIHRIVSSTMPRAEETARIIKKELGHRTSIVLTDDVRECVPGFPKALRKKFGFTDIKKMTKDKAVLDKAFKKHFKPTAKDSVEILVCHGNVIRYLVAKAMDAHPEAWVKMDIQQCGISVVELKSKGTHKMQVISHNDIGHIPKKHRTFI
jgi:serine/threonine-protein phosphatase PGAM5